MEFVEQEWKPIPDMGVLLWDNGHLIGCMGGRKYEEPKMKYFHIEGLERIKKMIPARLPKDKLYPSPNSSLIVRISGYNLKSTLDYLPRDIWFEIMWNGCKYPERIPIEQREMAKKLFNSCLGKLNKLKANIIKSNNPKYLECIKDVEKVKLFLISNRKYLGIEELETTLLE